MVVGVHAVLGIEALNHVKRALLDNVSVAVDDGEVKQVTFATVDANDVCGLGLLEVFAHHIVNVHVGFGLKVQANGHVEEELVDREALVFDKIVGEETCFRCIAPLPYGLVGGVCWLFADDALGTVKHFGLPVELVDHVGQVVRVEQCFPVKRVHIGRAFAVC